MLPLLVSGIPPWMPALGAAVVLTVVFAGRSPGTLRVALLSWPLVVFASGLFLAVGVLEAWGLPAVLSAATGSGETLPELWRLAGIGALAANDVNNLPAYLSLEPVADSPVRLAALLIGVGAGPLVTPWASLATLLWHERLRAAAQRCGERRGRGGVLVNAWDAIVRAAQRPWDALVAILGRWWLR